VRNKGRGLNELRAGPHSRSKKGTKGTNHTFSQRKSKAPPLREPTAQGWATRHSEILVGYRDGSNWAQDEYGRTPGNPKYRDREFREKEWITHHQAQLEWAKKRVGKSLAHVDDFDDAIHDKIMTDNLAEARGQTNTERV
jgi:hypothetical protein